MSLVPFLRSAALSLLCYCYLLSPFVPVLVSAAHIQVPIASAGHVFIVNATVGTPPQPFSLLVSPSSPHTWVPQDDIMPCMSSFDSLSGFHSSDGSSGSACGWGSFSRSASSTNGKVDQVFVNFLVGYTDTINVSGENMTDTLTVGDVKVDEFSLGLVKSVSNNQYIGMLGLGNDGTTLYPRASSRYRPNLIDNLVSSGKITTQGYSIWLDNPEGTSGTLLLGAIDKSRYQGDLIRLKTVQPYDIWPSAFAVSLNGVEVSGGKEDFKYDGAPVVVSVSPAETYSYLPDALAESIFSATGATWDGKLQKATIPCDAASKTNSLSKVALKLQLQGPDGPILDVRIADLVVPQVVTHWEVAYGSLTSTLSKNTCIFGIQKKVFLGTSNSNPEFNLGSSLLRRTYMVFDNVNKDIALAPVSPSAKSASANIIEFATTGSRIPSSTLYCIPSPDQPSSCVEDPDSDSNSDPTSPSSGGTSSGSSNSSDSSDNKKAIVIGVVVPLVVLAILLPLGYFLFIRRRKQKREAQADALREAQWERARVAHINNSRSDGSMLEDSGDADTFAEDEFGVKVTVSVSSKVSVMKQTPSPSPIRPDFGLGLPAGFSSSSSITPITEEKDSGGGGSKEKKSQYWGDAVLRAGGGGGTSDGNLSARSVSR